MVAQKIYEVSKAKATENINLKLGVLREFVTHGLPWKYNCDGEVLRDSETGARQLDFVPKNELAFAKWTTDTSKEKCYCNCDYNIGEIIRCYGAFTSHGPDTLKNRPKEHAKAKALFKAIKKTEADQLAKENQKDLLKQLTAEVSHLEAVAQEEGAYVVEAMDKMAKMDKQVKDLERALSEAKVAHEETVKRMTAEITSKDVEISCLRKDLTEEREYRAVWEKKWRGQKG